MKKLIALVAILSSGSLFADDDGDNTYGLLQVNSSDSRTIVAIPWIDASTTNGEIKVVDVVRTANLYPDDTIHYYNGTGYESWRLNDATQWVAAVQSSTSGSSQGVSPEEKALERGNALILMRTNSAHRAGSFYLWGQVASSTPTNVIARSGDAKVSSLIGPPVVTSDGMVNINNSDIIEWHGIKDGDTIYFETSSNRVECKRVDDVWKSYCVTNTTMINLGSKVIYAKNYGWANAAPIAAGTGFWYVTTNRTETTETTKVVWKGAPKVTPAVN